jgi:hypothetical protein
LVREQAERGGHDDRHVPEHSHSRHRSRSRSPSSRTVRSRSPSQHTHRSHRSSSRSPPSRNHHRHNRYRSRSRSRSLSPRAHSHSQRSGHDGASAAPVPQNPTSTIVYQVYPAAGGPSLWGAPNGQMVVTQPPGQFSAPFFHQ